MGFFDKVKGAFSKDKTEAKPEKAAKPAPADDKIDLGTDFGLDFNPGTYVLEIKTGRIKDNILENKAPEPTYYGKLEGPYVLDNDGNVLAKLNQEGQVVTVEGENLGRLSTKLPTPKNRPILDKLFKSGLKGKPKEEVK
jgi:hypothetical protein